MLNKDTVYYYGTVNSFYPGGTKAFSGYVLEERKVENCNLEKGLPLFDVYYKEFYTEEGKIINPEELTAVKLYNFNGSLWAEGQIKNGYKEGLWKYYDQMGHLKSIGEYIKNTKNGRWLYGDLSGLNFLTGQCFKDEEVVKQMLKLKAFNLTIIEEIYTNGVLLETVDFKNY